MIPRAGGDTVSFLTEVAEPPADALAVANPPSYSANSAANSTTSGAVAFGHSETARPAATPP